MTLPKGLSLSPFSLSENQTRASPAPGRERGREVGWEEREGRGPEERRGEERRGDAPKQRVRSGARRGAARSSSVLRPLSSVLCPLSSADFAETSLLCKCGDLIFKNRPRKFLEAAQRLFIRTHTNTITLMISNMCFYYKNTKRKKTKHE